MRDRGPYLSRRDKYKRKKLINFLSFVVICFTLSVLIIPAFTLEKDKNINVSKDDVVETTTFDEPTFISEEDENIMTVASSVEGGLDLGVQTEYIEDIQISYKGDDNNWHVVTDDSVKIPADKELKLSVKFKNIPIQALKDEFNATIVYSIPSILRYQNGNGTIHNDNNEVVGTTEISNGKIYLKYDATHLQELLNNNMNNLETGGFEVEGSANLSELPNDGKYTLNANKEYKFNFGSEPKAEYAKLFISKNQDSKTIFIDGKNCYEMTNVK